MGRRKIKDGDIYGWHYKSCEGMFEPYWCKSQIAVAHEGRLYDTFWGDRRSSLDRKKVSIRFRGNPADMQKISRNDMMYYRHQDIVDTRHSNSYSASVYIKPGATRNKKIILELIQYRKEKYERDIEWSKNKLSGLEDQLVLVADGNLNDVWFYQDND